MAGLNEGRVFTRVALALNGRYAVLARRTEGDDWVQVESVLGDEEAGNFADSLESDEGVRVKAVEDCAEESWGDDEPAQTVQ